MCANRPQESVWANTWNIRPYLFLFWFIFPGLAYWNDPWTDFHAQCLKLRAITQKLPFWGLHDDRKHLRGQIPQNRKNQALICSAERLSCASMKIDVIEEWRHWRVAALQRKRCQLVFDDHCQTYGNLCQTAVKMPNHYTHPHWPKQTTYALLCTSSSMNLEISAVIILWFLFWQCWTKYT